MRQIGKLDDPSHAERFVDLLAASGIDAKGEAGSGGVTIWVRDEDRLTEARALLTRFVADPDAAEFREAQVKARRARDEAAKRQQTTRRHVVSMRDRWSAPVHRRAPVTIVLICLSCAVALATGMGDSQQLLGDQLGGQVLRGLLIVDPIAAFEGLEATGATRTAEAASGVIDDAAIDDTWAFRGWSLRRGELWRLWTPCLIHFGVVHLLFNMLMLYRVGPMVESFSGSWRLALFVLGCGIAANVGGVLPEAAGGGWLAGGMSGVLYGLFGWGLMLQRYHRSRPVFFPPSTVFILLLWLVLGFTGMLDGPSTDAGGGYRIANWAHGVGFVSGLAVGYLQSLVSSRPSV